MVQIRKPVKLSDDIIDHRQKAAGSPAIQAARARLKAEKLRKQMLLTPWQLKHNRHYGD